MLGVSRLGRRLVGGIELEQVARGREQLADLPELRQRDGRRAATELVQAVDVRLERGALIPGTEGLVQIGVQPRDRHLAEDVGGASLEGSAEEVREDPAVGLARDLVAAARGENRHPVPERRRRARQLGIRPRRREKQQSRIRITSRTPEPATLARISEKAIPGVAGVPSRVATSVPVPAPCPAK